MMKLKSDIDFASIQSYSPKQKCFQIMTVLLHHQKLLVAMPDQYFSKTLNFSTVCHTPVLLTKVLKVAVPSKNSDVF